MNCRNNQSCLNRFQKYSEMHRLFELTEVVAEFYSGQLDEFALVLE